MNQELICIVCPMGCPIKIQTEKGEIISIEGNTCPRGKEYAQRELTNPMRVITTTIRTEDGHIIPVKTSGAVPKESMFDCMKVINNLHPKTKDCFVGSKIYENLLNYNVDVVVTAPLNRR